MADDNAIISFCEITSASPATARMVLEMANNDVESAVLLFYEHPELGEANRPSLGREDPQGIIHIDSDDDDENNGDDDDGRNAAQAAARSAQEDEDAAMARRLQEEMYSGQGGIDDDVRSPIARRTETLLGDDWDNRGMATAADHMVASRLMRQEGSSNNPFNQSIWTDNSRPLDSDGQASGPAAEADLRDPAVTRTYGSSRQQRLAELFRPPFDIMSRLDWDEAREDGKEMKKWILVNLQDMSNFSCQALNRDIWSNLAIKDIINENFIFLQYSRDDFLARKYIGFYFPGQSFENPDIYPHVCIVDPRTGEQVKIWSGLPFPTAQDFHAQLLEFLERYSLSSGSKNPVVKEVKRTRTIDVDRMTEEEMLEMALKNSLAADGSGASASNNPSGVVDPDEIAKDPLAQNLALEGETPHDPTPAPPSAFTTISSTSPHTEPAAGGPQVTRVQFRHPTGRVIRRFLLADPVRRMYEWLKAEREVIEGLEAGVEFELKAMPAGIDLIDKLDQNIGEMGLKNGTVMVEFV